jgi:4-hydroxy-3-polyprenylbenzoate decarboxylase
MAERKRLIVGISGASGAPIAKRLLEALSASDVESHLIISKGGELTIRQECGIEPDELCRLAAKTYSISDIGASPASGTWKHDGMVVVPCSMKTLAGIHSGYSDNLLLRAADVTLKERRRLVLVARETPLSTIHLRNMYELSQMGVTILPPVPGFYSAPETLDDIIDQTVGKILDQFGIDYSAFRRWDK